MKNFVFLSPNFPDNYYLFCQKLKENGLNVLGVGDCPYDNLRPELKSALKEYYKVGSLEHYDEVYRAVAYFIFKYGRVEWLESNNEYWLERDALLRRDFNITSGFFPDDMPGVKFKSLMKKSYQKAGIPTARFHMVDDFSGCMDFIKETGYPVIIKPDNGVGAVGTWKIENEGDLKGFFEKKEPNTYIMEEFIDGTVNSYDAIVNSRGEPIFETGNVTPHSLMEIVNQQGNSLFYIRANLPDELRRAGRAALKAFGVKSRFVHFEFFRLNRDQHIGKEGDIVALEVNMRPSGGISPSMMNYANGTDVYKIWADMIAFDRSDKPVTQRKFCLFAGRRDSRRYRMSREEVLARYAGNIKEESRVDRALAADMGDYMFVALFDTEHEVNDFYSAVLEEI